MIKQSLPAVTLLTPENFESFSTSDKVVIVGFFDATDKTSNATFSSLADSQRDNFLFGATSDATLAKQEGVTVPGVVMYKKYDDAKTPYTDKFEQAALQGWTKQNAVPLMGEVGPETYSGYIESGLPLAYIFVEKEDVKKKLGEELSAIARKYRGKVNFATIDAVQFGGHASNLNLYFPSSVGLFTHSCVVRKLGLPSQFKMSQRIRNSLMIKPRRLLPLK